MTSQPQPARRAAPPLPTIVVPPVDGPEDAEAICSTVEATMEKLLELIEGETVLLRDGKLFAAGELEPRKSDFARQYMHDLNVVRAIGPKLADYAPEAVERLRRLHDEFRSVLQINMAALATARAVSETLIQSVAEGIGQKGPPKVYSRSGVMPEDQLRATGLAVNKGV